MSGQSNIHFYETYLEALSERIPNHTVDQFIRLHEAVFQQSSMFSNYNSSNMYLRAFVRIILDHRDVLLPFAEEVFRASAAQPLRGSGYGEFRFMIPSGKQLCNQYYVSFSPLGVLFFLFAWMKQYHASVTNKYISDNEFTCIKNLIDSCRYSPNILLRATTMLNERPGTDICKAISRAVEIQERDPNMPIHLVQVALPGANARRLPVSNKKSLRV